MKVYYYSGTLLTYVRAKWTLAKLVTGGIVFGTILLLGFMQLNQSAGNTLGSRSANALAAENDILRQQLILIAPRVSRMEIQVEQLKERASGLHNLLESRKSARDTASGFTAAIAASRFRSSIAAAESPRP